MPVPAVPAVPARGLCWPDTALVAEPYTIAHFAAAIAAAPHPQRLLATLPSTVLAYGGRAVRRAVPMNVSHWSPAQWMWDLLCCCASPTRGSVRCSLPRYQIDHLHSASYSTVLLSGIVLNFSNRQG